MKVSTFGLLAASAVASVIGMGSMQAQAADEGEKACYRPHCGKSVAGHEGKCGGTRIDALNEQQACESAGGAWATAAEAEKFKK